MGKDDSQLSVTIAGDSASLRDILALADWILNEGDSQADDLPTALWHMGMTLERLWSSPGSEMQDAVLSRFGWLEEGSMKQEWTMVAMYFEGVAQSIRRAFAEVEASES